jgi:hypothetical protein
VSINFGGCYFHAGFRIVFVPWNNLPTFLHPTVQNITAKTTATRVNLHESINISVQKWRENLLITNGSHSHSRGGDYSYPGWQQP